MKKIVFCTFSFPLNSLDLLASESWSSLLVDELKKKMEIVHGLGQEDQELKASDEGHTESLSHTVIVNLGLYHSIMEKLVPLLEKA